MANAETSFFAEIVKGFGNGLIRVGEKMLNEPEDVPPVDALKDAVAAEGEAAKGEVANVIAEATVIKN